MKCPQVILGTMVHLWSVANPWWMPSLRVLPGSSAVPATLLELYRKWLPSRVGEAFSKPKRKGSTMPSQQRVKSIKATYGLLLGNSLIGLTSVQEIGPVDNPESLQNPIQSFFRQRWPRNRDGFWWCGSGLHVSWRAARHWNKIFTIFNLMNTTQCLLFSYPFNFHCYPTTGCLISSYTLLTMQNFYSCYNLRVSASEAGFPGMTFDAQLPH